MVKGFDNGKIQYFMGKKTVFELLPFSIFGSNKITNIICDIVNICFKIIGDVNIPCEYLVKGFKRSRTYENPPVNPDDAKLKHLCNKIKGPDNYIEDDEYLIYCKIDNHISCLIFRYMNNKCENLLLEETWQDNHKEPIVDLDGVKYKPICKKAKKEIEDDFIFCGGDNNVNCLIYKGEVDSNS
jgi:hypothetical protein